MNQIRTLSARIEAFVKSADLTNSPLLQQLLQEYAAGVSYVNRRLDQCEELLRNGRAGEAVTVAERCPSLFELVPLLQTPGTLEFFNLCRLYGLSEPPLVNVSVFQALKRASDDPAVQDGLSRDDCVCGESSGIITDILPSRVRIPESRWFVSDDIISGLI